MGTWRITLSYPDLTVFTLRVSGFENFFSLKLSCLFTNTKPLVVTLWITVLNSGSATWTQQKCPCGSGVLPALRWEKRGEQWAAAFLCLGYNWMMHRKTYYPTWALRATKEFLLRIKLLLPTLQSQVGMFLIHLVTRQCASKITFPVPDTLSYYFCVKESEFKY